jgi:hypothetical protein
MNPKTYQKTKVIIYTTVIVLILCFSLPALNWYTGYHGHGKEKARRNSDGNRQESIYRKAFVKDLAYQSNLGLDSFQIFIEKGYKYGYFSAGQTNFELDDDWPFQLSHTQRTPDNNTTYYTLQTKSGTMDDHRNVYLKTPRLKDTLVMAVHKFRMTKENGVNKAHRDSIGYIKVFENK